MGRAVISLLEHLGDVVAAEPVARHLKSQGHHVTWCVSERYKDLVEPNPHVDETRVLGCLSEWEAMPYERDYDVVADLHFDNRLCGATKKPVRKRSGDLSVGLDNYLDHGSLLAAFCAAAGLPRLDDPPILHVPAGAPPIKGAYAVMHCGANEEEREWRDHSWRMLAYDLVDAGLPVLEVGGRPVLEGMRGVESRGVLSVANLAAAVAGASLFIGCESGPAHVANALRKECVIVAGRCRRWSRYNVWTGHLRDNAHGSVVSLGTPVRDVPYTMVRSLALAKAALALSK